jgi:hypothetical protein
VNETGIIKIRRRTLVTAAVAIAAAVVLVAVMATGVLGRAADAKAVAGADALKTQQAAAERDVERAYERSVEQVKTVRGLKLAITAAQADAIANKALADLMTLRHSAFVSMAPLLGLADAEGYAAATEQRFDKSALKGQASPAPVLLAPRLYQIASRMSDVATQISDKATTDMTAPPGSPSPSPTGTPRPSPSPTRP